MEDAALCFSLMVQLLVLLVDPCCCAQRPALPRVLPDRLQFFEYEAVSFDCAESSGSTEWRLMRKLKQRPKKSASWNASSPSVSLHPAFSHDSGEFWCEDAEGNTSDALNISVTVGSVILEVPARPVEEGGHLILRCKKKDDPEPIADFYRDASHLGTRYKGNLTVPSVSEGDAGLYWCSVSGVGESPRSRLRVRNHTGGAGEETGHLTPTTPTHLNSTHLTPTTPTHPPDHTSFPLLGVVVGVLVGAPLLLGGGLLLWRNHRGRSYDPVSGQEAVDQDHEYAVVKKTQRTEKVSRAGDTDLETYAVVQENNNVSLRPEVETYAVVQKKKKKESEPRRPEGEEDGVYSFVS